MTELLTFDQAVAERKNPSLQYRQKTVVRGPWKDFRLSYWPFWEDDHGHVSFGITRQSTYEFRLKPEPREWWEVRDDGRLVEGGLFNSFESARDAVLTWAVNDACEYKIFHVREVLADE